LTKPNPEALLQEAFANDVDLTGLLERILEIIVRATNAQRGFVLLTTPFGTPFARVVHRMVADELPERDVVVSRTIVQRVLATNKSILLDNALDNPEFHRSESVHKLSLRSVVCAPLQRDAVCCGVVYLENRTLAGVFKQDDLARVEDIAKSVSRRLSTYLALHSHPSLSK
jgi:GAF domain-containing protein